MNPDNPNFRSDAELQRQTKYHRIITKLENQLTLAVNALKEINREEINSQRPGGGYSKSAKISFKVLQEISKLKE